jgi:hypothetical protein
MIRDELFRRFSTRPGINPLLARTDRPYAFIITSAGQTTRVRNKEIGSGERLPTLML